MQAVQTMTPFTSDRPREVANTGPGVPVSDCSSDHLVCPSHEAIAGPEQPLSAWQVHRVGPLVFSGP